MSPTVVRELTWPGGWPIGIFSTRYFRGMPLNAFFQYYGGTECSTFLALKAMGFKGCMIKEFVDKRNFDFCDPQYIQWKARFIGQSNQPSFEEWVKNGCP